MDDMNTCDVHAATSGIARKVVCEDRVSVQRSTHIEPSPVQRWDSGGVRVLTYLHCGLSRACLVEAQSRTKQCGLSQLEDFVQSLVKINEACTNA
jgi:hypothetical protein